MCVSVDSFFLVVHRTRPHTPHDWSCHRPKIQFMPKATPLLCLPILESHIIGVAAAACARTHISSFSSWQKAPASASTVSVAAG
jgi:hypothetical protein